MSITLQNNFSTLSSLVQMQSRQKQQIDLPLQEVDEIKFSSKDNTSSKNIVIVGNGLGGVAVARNLNKFLKKNGEKATVTIIGKDDQYVFKPMLPDAMNSDPASIPMEEALGKDSPINFKQAEVTGITVNGEKAVQTSEGSLPYDYLVLAVGGRTNFFNTPGAEDYSLTLENRHDLDRIQSSALKKLAEAKVMSPEELKENNPLNFTIVGAGATGVELAFELKHYIDRLLLKEKGAAKDLEAEITLIEATDDILPGFAEEQKAIVKDRLDKHGINVKYKTSVKQVTENQGLLAKDKNVEPPVEYTIDTVDPIWVTGVRANALSEKMEVERVKGKEQIIVDGNLTLPDDDNIYVIGDVAAAKDKKTDWYFPSTGQVAEQQGAFVADDLIKRLKGKESKRKEFEYKNKGLMLSAGPSDGFAHLFQKVLLKGKLASRIRQGIYKNKLHKGTI